MSLGTTILPVCPICMSLGTIPASTAALLAPRAAPSLSARGSSTMPKLSPLFIPRPPLTTTEAAPRSGRSDLLSSCPTNSDVPAVEASPARAASSEAEPPVVAAASNAVVLTVTILSGSRDFRVMMALPAYTVLTNVSLSLMPMMSEIGETSSWAARRGRTEREKAEAPAMMCVYLNWFCAETRRGVRQQEIACQERVEETIETNKQEEENWNQDSSWGNNTGEEQAENSVQDENMGQEELRQGEDNYNNEQNHSSRREEEVDDESMARQESDAMMQEEGMMMQEDAEQVENKEPAWQQAEDAAVSNHHEEEMVQEKQDMQEESMQEKENTQEEKESIQEQEMVQEKQDM